MTVNINPQNPNDPDPQATQLPPPPPAGGDGASPWYYRPVSGLADWAARLAGPAQGSNAGGTVNGEDLQLPASAQNAGSTDGIGQNQPGASDPATGSGMVRDFLGDRPSPMQQNKAPAGAQPAPSPTPAPSPAPAPPTPAPGATPAPAPSAAAPNANAAAAAPAPNATNADPNAQRNAMAQQIVDYEARRDASGNLQVYKLPKNDGGGNYEVAGINDRYDGPMFEKLRQLVQAGKGGEAEAQARDYIAGQTDAAARWTSNPAIEFFLRDSIFNRGQGGAAKILQRALGVPVDGGAGPVTLAAEKQAEADPAAFLLRLRQAREDYEYQNVGRRDNLDAGLVDRWNNVLQHSQAMLQAQ